MQHDQLQVSAPDTRPEVITRYLTAHRAHDTAVAIAMFTQDATAIDDGNTCQGTAAIERWLNRSATEFTHTIGLTGAERTDARHYTATHHLEGDFPGGTVDPRYRFRLRGDLVERLVIEP
jgi:ketosteroid isomerase-like protein